MLHQKAEQAKVTAILQKKVDTCQCNQLRSKYSDLRSKYDRLLSSEEDSISTITRLTRTLADNHNPSPVEEELKQEEIFHCHSSAKPKLTQEQVDAILAHAKEEQDRNAKQERIELAKLKKQFKQSEDLVQRLRSTHDESLNEIEGLTKIVKDSDQKLSDNVSKTMRQAQESIAYHESLVDDYKVRARFAEGQRDSSEQAVKTLRAKFRQKQPSTKSQPFAHAAPDAKIHAEVESFKKQLKDVNSKNQALRQELGIAKSAPTELAVVKAHSDETKAQLDEKTATYTELESQMAMLKSNSVSVLQWKTTREQLDSKSKAYTELESQLQVAKTELAGEKDAGVAVQSQLRDTKAQLSSKTKAYAQLESQLEEATRNWDDKNSTGLQS